MSLGSIRVGGNGNISQTLRAVGSYRFTVENGLVDSLYETFRRLRYLRFEVEKWMPMTESAAAAKRSKSRYVAPSVRWSRLDWRLRIDETREYSREGIL